MKSDKNQQAVSARQALEYAAAQLGFSGIGVADASLPQGTGLADFIAAGKHADMAWLERHLPARQNPELVLPGVQCVVMLTYEYPKTDARSAAGHIARYAQGDDYHKLLSAKLADLDETLQFYGGRQRCFTDSGPVSERFFAAQAGLGWIGRNGLLIRPRGGSYCFLASILTTLKLPLDSPMKNRCGNCHRCEQACPTGALQDGCCDARRCLSFWTIEARNAAPPEIAANKADRLYGCDTCQEVCPWNNLPSPHRIDPHLLMPAALTKIEPEELATLNDAEFEQFFNHSPIRRIGAEHLRANISDIHF